MAPARDLSLSRELARELHHAVPHLIVWETTDYVAIGTGPDRYVWAFLQPVYGESRIRFEVPDDGTAQRVVERLTCRAEAGPVPGRSDSRVAVFMKRVEDLHEGGVCWQIPTLLEGFRRLDGRARSEADLLR